MRITIPIFLMSVLCSHIPLKGPRIVARNLPDTMDALVYQGTKSLDGEFPEVGWIGNCTATLVSPTIIFTAGHCRGTNQTATFQHRESGRSYQATCLRHPRYNSRTIYNDFAFCKLSEPVPEGSHMAQLDLVNRPVQGAKLLLNGFGMPNLVKHYWGQATVRANQGQDIVSCGPANLGSGDSGGSMFDYTDDRTKDKVRKILGINSRAGSGCSYFNSTAHSDFVSFAKDYETLAQVEICGISKNCEKPTEPIDCNLLYLELAECIKPALEPATCQEKYRLFGQCIAK